MSQDKKELTEEQIKEAIREKHCPYCKSRKFVGDFPAWQRFDFYTFKGLRAFYHDPETESPFESVECGDCQEEIPEVIWREWEL